MESAVSWLWKLFLKWTDGEKGSNLRLQSSRSTGLWRYSSIGPRLSLNKYAIDFDRCPGNAFRRPFLPFPLSSDKIAQIPSSDIRIPNERQIRDTNPRISQVAKKEEPKVTVLRGNFRSPCWTTRAKTDILDRKKIGDSRVE